MPPKQKEQGQQFNFIIFDHPAEGRGKAVRKEIRSHVTARQHRMNREARQRAAGSRATTPNPQAVVSEGEDVDGISTAKSNGEDKGDGQQNEAPESQHASAKGDSSEQLERRAWSGREELLSVENILRSAPLASRASRVKILNDPWDDIGKILGRLRLNFAMVMDHYSWIVATQARDFEKHFMTDRQPGSGHETLIPGIAKDPALVATAVLIAAGHMLAIRNAPMSDNIARCVYELRNFTLAHINAAIQDASRAISDPLLVAILIIAAHEGLQGSATNYHIHMRGLVQMINMRGGLHKLDESQTYLKKFIIWQDTNVATIMRCRPYHLTCENSQDAPTVTPNPRMWLLMDEKPP